MQSIRTSKAAIAGATLVFAFLAAVTLTMAPGAAHAQILQVRQASTMLIDNLLTGGTLVDIGVNYTGAGCAVTLGAWSCPNWSIFGGAIPNGTLLGTITLFTLGVHLHFSQLMLDFPAPGSNCRFLLGLRLLDFTGNDMYGFLGILGNYSLVDCTQGEIDLIVHTVGTSPSSAHVLANWLINHV